MCSLVVSIIALTYLYSSNAYFGWSMSMESDAEVIADGISAFLVALSFLTLAIERKSQ